MENLKLLPLGIQNFSVLREKDCLYVDKTRLIHQLTHTKRGVFLSRPRRFGKSLLLSTLRYYFQGRRDLFRGLAIEELEGKEKEPWTEYPVMYFSLASGDFTEEKGLSAKLRTTLNDFEDSYGLPHEEPSLSIRFAKALENAAKKTGKRVVVLIDEYDNPLLKNMTANPAQEEANRTLYKAFFAALKDCDEFLQFYMFTGVTKFSKVSIFSDLNQLTDISLDDEYSGICGISQQELEDSFSPYIDVIGKKFGLSHEECLAELKRMYDGYHFSGTGEGMYNPFSILHCFDEKKFSYYWFESGTPSFLVKTLQKQPLFLASLVNGRKVKEDQFKNYDPDSKNMLPVVYQSGYLTITGFDEDSRRYTLDFPNQEIKDGFLDVLLKKFVTVPDDDLGLAIDNLCDALKARDMDKALSVIQSAIADLPTIVKKDMCENYYESVTHLMFRMTGCRVVSELQSVAGRSDVVVSTKDAVFIFELKMDKGQDFESVAEAALAQIDANGYSDRFAVSGKQMVKVALVFSSGGKGLLGWKTA